ncbi:MAG: biotin--[acetyl-CoA-carboxylase] ligase [Micavibrio sp.]|nr:biotin--[acetyl-CoA-carboxylase] ligase [Micavibrio sp.]
MTYQPQLPQDMSIVELQTVGSTNSYARDLAKDGAQPFTIVWSHEQTAGKGRQGNVWVSNRGNLFMTVILRPNIAAPLTGQLSFIAAVALAETLKELLPQMVNIDLKWPNDLLLNGKKAAGILLESEINGHKPVEWVIVGMGVNVSHNPDGATCLRSLGLDTLEIGQLLEKLAMKLKSIYDLWQKNGFAPIRQEWLRYSHAIGTVINVRLPKETLTGKFMGIDAQGALQLDMPDGTTKNIASGEVFYGV